MNRIRIGLLAAGLLASTVAAVPASGSVSATPAAKASVAGCDPLPNARVAKGVKNGSDPNDLTRAQSAAAEKAVAAKLRAKGLTWSSGVKWKVTVDVHVHVITRADGTGGVTRKQVKQQIAVMNDGYAGTTAKKAAATPFRFTLKSLDYTANDDWYDWAYPDPDVPADTDDAEAKAALHRGGLDDLNVYIASLADGLLGYADYPWELTSLEQDGLVLLNESLPGGAAEPYNEGDTATHEVGHWLGLAHTFENGCTEPGDFVADTPYQADGDNIFNCNESDDTCPAKGKDPVHNFMSYGDDPCLDRFTPGQSTRMSLIWAAYRSGL